jgi:transposase
MHIQYGLRKNNILNKFVLGSHPIIQYFIDKLRIPDIIGTYAGSDKRRKVDTEKVLCLLIHNFLTSPLPLYEIQDWLKPLDGGTLGLDQRDIGFIYDERIARALDDLYKCKNKDIFLHLSLRAIKIFELKCSQMHNDTTTITFSGKYSDWNAEEELTYGHNKDHRPDLKQLLLGVTVTADGAVPLLHEVYDGNQTDDQTHLANHKRLQKLLSCSDFIYVADGKLTTDQNLQKIQQWGGRFVSIMPRTWKEDMEFRAFVRSGSIKWLALLSRQNSRKPKSKKDHYYLADGIYKTHQGYNLLWILSTQKLEQDAETRVRRISRALDDLRALQTKLNKYNLKSKDQIEGKIKLILKENKCNELISYSVHAHQEYREAYDKTGRPAAGNLGKKITKTLFSISFMQNDKAIKEQSKTDGVFPLITNLNLNEYRPSEVLEIYKFQPFLEKRYSQIKTPQEVAPVYLKDGKRCVALLHMQIMALMVASLIERELRLAMKNRDIKSLNIYPENRPCKTPTMTDLVRLFKNVERYEVTQSETMAVYPANLNGTQKEVLKLLGVPLSSYQ